MAWVSLGPLDDDVRALWTAVAHSSRPVGRASERQRTSGRSRPTRLWRRCRGGLLRDSRGDGTPVVLVLDNLHEITSLAVHESLLRLVQRPPQNLRFVATTRQDPPWPLHRLRLEGVISEIRADELAFRVDETAALLDQLGIDLDSSHVGRLVERTEGGRPVSAWPPSGCRAAKIPPGSSMPSPATTTRWPPTC